MSQSEHLIFYSLLEICEWGVLLLFLFYDGICTTLTPGFILSFIIIVVMSACILGSLFLFFILCITFLIFDFLFDSLKKTLLALPFDLLLFQLLKSVVDPHENILAHALIIQILHEGLVVIFFLFIELDLNFSQRVHCGPSFLDSVAKLQNLLDVLFLQRNDFNSLYQQLLVKIPPEFFVGYNALVTVALDLKEHLQGIKC